MTYTFFEVKKIFLKRNKQKQSLICLKNCEINNFLAVRELCTFYIEYKKVKFTAINVRDRTDILCNNKVGDFVKIPQVSSLPLLKITTKLTHFLPAKKNLISNK